VRLFFFFLKKKKVARMTGRHSKGFFKREAATSCFYGVFFFPLNVMCDIQVVHGCGLKK
jgi:hypothetical protein